MKGLGGMMKQAQQLQEKMQQAQDEIANMQVVGESGAGMVKVTMTGRHDVRKVEIDNSLLQDDKEILEDLIAAAVNDANRRVESETQERMSSVTQGLPIPPGFKMPF